MTLTVDDIIEKSPTKRLPIIDGEPDYASISMMVQLLYSNAATLVTTLRGGHNGHIGIIMPAELYATLSDIPYHGPPDPGPIPTHAVAANAATSETINHKAAQKLFGHHNNMSDALKTQIIDTVADTYTSVNYEIGTLDTWGSLQELLSTISWNDMAALQHPTSPIAEPGWRPRWTRLNPSTNISKPSTIAYNLQPMDKSHSRRSKLYRQLIMLSAKAAYTTTPANNGVANPL
jgi:hypothetical protein